MSKIRCLDNNLDEQSCMVKVGFLVSYDYEYLYSSLPLAYNFADLIVLAIDRDRKTWSGEYYELNDSFFEWVKEIDIEGKVKIYEDSFYIPTLNVMQNDTRERNMLAHFMGDGGWHVQIDSDEYIIDFDRFKDFLVHGINEYVPDIDTPVNVYMRVITIFKQVNEGYLLIDCEEFLPFATRHPNYNYSRVTDSDLLLTGFRVLHQSWGRSDKALLQKLKNWSHKDDFNVMSYFNFWKACDRFNFKYYKDFHPLNSDTWKELTFIQANSVSHLVETILNNEELGEVLRHYSPRENQNEGKKKKRSKWNFFGRLKN